MIVGRKLKRNIFIDTDIDCQNCGCWQRVCTWNGECDNLEPMTNEEWFTSLSTEEKAKWLYDHYVNARADEYYGRQEKTLSEYQKWLVSVHRGIDGTKID